MKYKRIMVAGCSGSGKSTFSRELAKRTGLPLIHLDREYWLEGWVEPPKEAWRTQVEDLVAGNSWIIDGNYSGTWDIRLHRTQLVIYLQYPLLLILFRATKRMLSLSGSVRPDMAPGCPERFNWAFLHFIFVCYLRRKKHHLSKLEAAMPDCEVLIFKRPKAAQRWLQQFASA